MKDETRTNKLFQDLFIKGNTAARGEDYDTACQLYLEAAQTASHDPLKLAEAGMALHGINRFGKAHAVFVKLLNLDPESTIAHIYLGSIYLNTGRNAAAEQHLEKASVARPEDPNIYFSLGKACQFQTKIEKALKAYRKAVQFGKFSSPHYHQQLATILEVANNLDELGDILDDALKIYPDDDLLNLLLAKSERRQGNGDAALERLKKLQASELNPKFLSIVFYEMGHIYDRRKSFESAFACFRKGNALHKEVFKQLGINKEESRRNILAMRSLDLDMLHTKPPPDSSAVSPNPVFIVGFPRSGTTLLHHILESHPLIDVLEEKPLLNTLKSEVEKLSSGYPTALLSLTGDIIEELRGKYFEAAAVHANKDKPLVTIDKFPLNLIDLPLVSALFPQAIIIIALRHPADSCLSCFMQRFNPNTSMANFLNLDDTSSYYSEAMGLLDSFRELLPLQYYSVRYENIVKDLEGEARKIIEFLELEWNPAVLDYQSQARSKTIINTPSYHQVVQPLYTDSTARWRYYDKYLAPYKDRLEPFCRKFVYSL